jgi:PAS domain-containing protein
MRLWSGEERMAHPIEVILAKQLAGHLATPTFVVNPVGSLLYYNESAERLLGHRFEETGEMSLEEWSTAFEPSDEEGRPLPPADLPLVIALEKRTPAHRPFRIRGLDGVTRDIAVTAFPLEGDGGRFVGAVALFWEAGQP